MNETVFNKIKNEAEATGEMSRESFVFMAVMDMVDEVADEWGEYICFCPARSSDGIEGSRPVFEDFNTNMVITENGKIYKVKAETYKTGGKVWNGDDVYLDEIGTKYLDAVFVEELTVYPTLASRTDLTLDVVENAASEIVSTICQ